MVPAGPAEQQCAAAILAPPWCDECMCEHDESTCVWEGPTHGRVCEGNVWSSGITWTWHKLDIPPAQMSGSPSLWLSLVYAGAPGIRL